MNQSWKRDYFRYKEYLLTTINLYRGKQDIRLFLEILLSIITITFFSAFAIRPTIYTILDLTKDIKAKEETILVMNEKIENIKKARSLYQSQIENIKLLDSAIPKEPELASFVAGIEFIAVNNGVTIQGLSTQKIAILGAETEADPKAAKLPQNSESLNIKMNVNGSFASLQSFYRDLNNLIRPMKGTLNISLSGMGDKRTISLTITGQTPYIKQ